MVIVLRKLTTLKGFYRKTKTSCLSSWTPCILHYNYKAKTFLTPSSIELKPFILQSDIITTRLCLDVLKRSSKALY